MMAAARSALAACLLLPAAWAQQAGTMTSEEHPPMPIAHCSRGSGCTLEKGSVTLDSQWRWAHDGNMNGCFADGAWSAALCSDPLTCASECQLEGLDTKDYSTTYGVSAIPGGVQMDFAVPGGSVGSRLYLLEGDSMYKMFKLKNREFTFDVDLSSLPCGLNGAVYFVEMDASGGSNGGSNKAGAKYGTGYCDAQCPRDLKFIGGEANVLHWNATSGEGRYGACCTEMDLWEANREAAAYTAHNCDGEGMGKCDWTKSDCNGVCDRAGCDFNSYRLGDHSFYGPGSTFDVDTSKPITIVTQFITDDGTDDGELVEIRRLYVQAGKIVHNSASPELSHGGHSITDDWCAEQKKTFDNPNDFKKKGGLKAMGDALQRGMVLVLSIWDDSKTGMTWLDADSPLNASSSKPGVQRGPCSPHSGKSDKELRVNHPGAAVKYTNLAYGEIDSTYGKDDAKHREEKKSADFCCLAGKDADDICGSCFSSAQAPANTFCGQDEETCRSCGSHAHWCPATAHGGKVKQPANAEIQAAGQTGEVALTLEGLNIPAGMLKGDMVTLTINGQPVEVQVVSAPSQPPAASAASTSHAKWDFLPVLQRNDKGAQVAAAGSSGFAPSLAASLGALTAMLTMALVAARFRRRPDYDGVSSLPLVPPSEEASTLSPTKKLQFDSPVRRPRRSLDAELA